jgi:hypothetical protein
MKNLLHNFFASVCLIVFPAMVFGQAPNLGTAAEFVLFSTVGAVSNMGNSHMTGNVGSNNGSSTGFGNVNGGMHDNDGISAQAATDLLALYTELNSTIPNFAIAAALGGGDTLVAGVYAVSAAATIDLELILDAQNDPNAVFIFKISGPLSTGTNAKVNLINGAQACNVFWKVEGLVSLGSGTFMRGNIVANNAAIVISANDTLQGRALSIAGAVTVDGTLAYIPIGCGRAVLVGAVAPDLGSAACFAIFSADGPVTNAGVSYATGDIGTNVGLTVGFNQLHVVGQIYPIPTAVTAACATDLGVAYTYLNLLPADIELLYPAQFGSDLVLTAHTYVMNGAVDFVDTLYLHAHDNPDAVFVIKVYGAFSAASYSSVVLAGGAQAKNVYWLIDGAVELNDYATFVGTIICNNGAIDLKTGVRLDGRALTTVGAVGAAAVNVTIPASCLPSGIDNISLLAQNPAMLFPNPFDTHINIQIPPMPKAEFTLYNALGVVVLQKIIYNESNQIDTQHLPTGTYFYILSDGQNILQSGKLISVK